VTVLDTPFSQELYQRTLPLAVDDAENALAWAVLCTAMGMMFDPFEFVRDSDDGLGYTALMDLDRAPADGLGWLGMFAGVVTIPGLDDTEQRERIDATEGFQRGTPAAIAKAGQRHLTGTKRVTLVERYGGDAYVLRVITYEAETPDEDQTRADLMAAKPIGLILDYVVLPGWVIDEMEAFYVGDTIAGGPESDFSTITDFEQRVV
jgi:hypothetical protein